MFQEVKYSVVFERRTAFFRYLYRHSWLEDQSTHEGDIVNRSLILLEIQPSGIIFRQSRQKPEGFSYGCCHKFLVWERCNRFGGVQRDLMQCHAT
jgi:hypothetical protein